MCVNPLKAVPNAVGGLLGGPMLKSVFGGDKKKRPEQGERTTVTQGTVGPGPTVGAY